MKTAECVTPKHPDKICDIVSDAILDECLKQDPFSRVAVETMGGHGIITITGEVTSKAKVNYRKIAKDIVDDRYGVQVNIVEQSPEIANGVDTGGAGDQGIMVGYACDDNKEMIPQELYLARELCKSIYKRYPYDGKTQITLDDEGFITAVVASFQNVSYLLLHEKVGEWLDTQINFDPNNNAKIYCNPAGDWSQGGFEADTGLTGRKLAVDNYGPQIPIGGGAFSGKDATKVDRSGAYMARKVAIDYLKKYKAKEVMVKIAYSIGVKEPVQAIAIVDSKEMTICGYDLSPQGIIDFLKLREPQYKEVAEWGSFGREFNWDK